MANELRNLRSLEGLPAAAGYRVRAGCLYRSEAPVHLSDDARARLDALLLQTVIDLRGAHERGAQRTYVPAGADRVEVEIAPPRELGRVPLDDLLAGKLLDYSVDELGMQLVNTIDGDARAFGRVVRHLTGRDALPALVHCTAGKDRTGLVIALVLEAVGVERGHIVDDFELSTEGRAHRAAELSGRLIAVGTSLERVAPLFTAPRIALERTLRHIDHRYGGVTPYLVHAGECEVGDLVCLADRLLERDATSRAIR
jgi:protein-tyrosine phosphatase